MRQCANGTRQSVLQTLVCVCLRVSFIDSYLQVPFFIFILVLQGPPHQTSSTTTSGSNVNTNTPSPGPYVSDQYGMYTTRLS